MKRQQQDLSLEEMLKIARQTNNWYPSSWGGSKSSPDFPSQVYDRTHGFDKVDGFVGNSYEEGGGAPDEEGTFVSVHRRVEVHFLKACRYFYGMSVAKGSGGGFNRMLNLGFYEAENGQEGSRQIREIYKNASFYFYRGKDQQQVRRLAGIKQKDLKEVRASLRKS